MYNCRMIFDRVENEYVYLGFSNNTNFNKIHLVILKKEKTWSY